VQAETIERPSLSAADDAIALVRADIDEIDNQLLDLFNRRARCAIEIGMIKRRLQLPVDVPEREAGVIARVVGENAGPLDNEAIMRLFEVVIGESRIAERAVVG
jgi:chorismate mutase